MPAQSVAASVPSTAVFTNKKQLVSKIVHPGGHPTEMDEVKREPNNSSQVLESLTRCDGGCCCSSGGSRCCRTSLNVISRKIRSVCRCAG